MTMMGRGILVVFCGLICLAPLHAQYRGAFGNPQPVVRGGVPSVVYPGGTPATSPNITRTLPNVVYPGGGGPRLAPIVPFSVTDPGFAQRMGSAVRGGNFMRPGFSGGRHSGGGAMVVPYAVPVYIGGYGDASYGYMSNGYTPSGAMDQQQQQPNIIVIYPQQAPASAPVYAAPPEPPVQSRMYTVPEQTAAEEPPPSAEPSHYLIAFRDRTIYSAVAYWVDGDTLHYFTNGNTHNQVSLTLVDRALTERLNREGGIEMKLPPAK